MDEFIQVYYLSIREGRTAYFAYLDAEAKHIEQNGSRRYASYSSFKAAKSRKFASEKEVKKQKNRTELFLFMLKTYVPADQQEKLEKRWKNIG